MHFKKDDIIGNYTVLFAHKDSEKAESYRVKDANGTTQFLQILKDAESSETYRHYSGLPGLPVYIDEGTVSIPMSDASPSGSNPRLFITSKFVSAQSLAEYLRMHTVLKPHTALSITRELIKTIQGIISAGGYHTALNHNNVHIPLTEEPIGVFVTGMCNIYPKESATRFTPVLADDTLIQSPEYFHREFSEQSEVYAIGALLYEMCFGMHPWDLDLSIFPETNRVLFLLKAKSKPLAIPQLTTSQPDSRIIAIIEKAVKYKADERFQSLDDMLQAVEDIITEMDRQQQQPKDINVRKGNGFKDIAGLSALKERIQREVIELLRDPEGAREFGISIPNGILLYGPPGCGKTFFAEKMAEEIGCNYMYVKCSDVASPYIHGGQEKIAAIFDEARSKAPSLLFLDEVDAMLMKRSRQNNVSESGEVNEFLTQLNNCGESNVIVVAATNRVDDIDEAATRSGRLELKYLIDLPDEDTLVELFRICLAKTKSAVTDFRTPARKMKGRTPADVQLVVNTAAREAFHLKKPVDMSLLDNAIDTVLGKKTSSGRPKIGFHI